MVVKLMRGTVSKTFECNHIEVLELTEESPIVRSGGAVPGIRVQMFPKGTVLRLPDDGDDIYVMSDAGNTIGDYHWPPRKKPQAVVGEVSR